MTASPTNSWDISELFSDILNFDFASPRPHQDSELLRQLGFIPGLKEVLMLRQVHALEHATVWVLSEWADSAQVKNVTTQPQDDGSIGGISTDQGFYLYGRVDTLVLKRAVRTALGRITQGEWKLAVHPRCGTNLSVGMALTAGFALGFHLLLPRGPIEQLLGLGLAATTAAQLAPEFGSVAQQYLTTAIPFNLTVEDVVLLPNESGLTSPIPVPEDLLPGSPAHFVRVRWVE